MNNELEHKIIGNITKSKISMSHRSLNHKFNSVISILQLFFENNGIFVNFGRSCISSEYDEISMEVWISKTIKNPEQVPGSKMFYVAINNKGNCLFKQYYQRSNTSVICAEIELNAELIQQELELFVEYIEKTDMSIFY